MEMFVVNSRNHRMMCDPCIIQRLGTGLHDHNDNTPCLPLLHPRSLGIPILKRILTLDSSDTRSIKESDGSGLQSANHRPPSQIISWCLVVFRSAAGTGGAWWMEHRRSRRAVMRDRDHRTAMQRFRQGAISAVGSVKIKLLICSCIAFSVFALVSRTADSMRWSRRTDTLDIYPVSRSYALFLVSILLITFIFWKFKRIFSFPFWMRGLVTWCTNTFGNLVLICS